MGMLSDSEMKEALAEAGRMREVGEDPHHVAHALLNMRYQNVHYGHLMEAVEHYMRSGMATLELQRMRIAIEKTRLAIDRTANLEPEKFGLE